MPLNDPTFQALLREGSLAASLAGRGATILSDAGASSPAYYSQAFFNLSIGLERLCKLIFVIDTGSRTGEFPTDLELRALGHNLVKLVNAAEEIRARIGVTDHPLPTDAITSEIITFLSDFSNASRYYNLDYISGGRNKSYGDPISGWFDRVVMPLATKHYLKSAREKTFREARLVAEIVDPFAYVRHVTEDGRSISTMSEKFAHGKMVQHTQKYARMYVLRIIRSLAAVLRYVQYEAQSKGLPVPHLTELFAIFNNKDDYFLRRKTWDPYKP